MQHVIQRQIIEINTADIESANVMQQRMERLFKSELMPVMDEVLSSFSEPGSLIRLEKLELDLGTFSMNVPDTQFTENLRIQLIRELKKELSRSSDTDQHNSSKANIQSQEESDIELALYFLQRGVLPWWVADAQEFQPQTLLDKLLKKEPGVFIRSLENLNSIQAIERLVMQLTTFNYNLLLSLLFSKTEKKSVMAIKDWHTLIETDNFSLQKIIQIKARLIYFLLQNFPGERLAERPAELLSEYIYQTALMSSGSDTAKNTVTSLAGKAQGSLSKESEVYHWLEQKILTLFPKKEVSRPAVINNSVINITDDKSADSKAVKKHLFDEKYEQKHAKKSNTSFEERAPENEASFDKDTLRQLLPKDAAYNDCLNTDQHTGEYYYIDNAGVVLLWPFLSRYFSTLNLLKDNKFVNEQSQEKAVVLLQYMVSGNVEPQEHVLLLSKLLCGWPLHRPLLRCIDLTQQDKQESEQLMLSVINHWKALKNTSMDGLRQSFLQREGRLIEKDYGWDLLIKRTGFDVLLDQLPWGISTIHLSWMKKTVFVEW